MLWDVHMHTHHSGDSDAAPEDMVKSAIEKKLDGLCFTDHYDYDYAKEPELFLLNFEDYRREILSLREKYDGKFHILWGVELGLQPHIASENKQVAASYPFDFIIGSSHVVHGIDPYYSEYYDGRGESEAYLEYFESILENLATDVDFDVYGHIDYVVRYGPNKNKFYSYERYAEIIDEILRTLIRMGKGIELNTGGFRHGIGQPNPAIPVLKRYRELGGEILTLGSDAHSPDKIALEFSKVPAILQTAGFTHYTVFEARKPHFFPI